MRSPGVWVSAQEELPREGIEAETSQRGVCMFWDPFVGFQSITDLG